MIYCTNAHTIGNCCAICHHWCGDAVERYNPATGFVCFDDSETDLCELRMELTYACEACEEFSLECIYSPPASTLIFSPETMRKNEFISQPVPPSECDENCLKKITVL